MGKTTAPPCMTSPRLAPASRSRQPCTHQPPSSLAAVCTCSRRLPWHGVGSICLPWHGVVCLGTARFALTCSDTRGRHGWLRTGMQHFRLHKARASSSAASRSSCPRFDHRSAFATVACGAQLLPNQPHMACCTGCRHETHILPTRRILAHQAARQTHQAFLNDTLG